MITPRFDYARHSFWLETTGEDLVLRAALTRSSEVDVAIMGGGYTGLWTAYYLLRETPGITVAVVEKEIVGFGVSGRNGGWCSSKFPVTPRDARTAIWKQSSKRTNASDERLRR